MNKQLAQLLMPVTVLFVPQRSKPRNAVVSMLFAAIGLTVVGVYQAVMLWREGGYRPMPAQITAVTIEAAGRAAGCRDSLALRVTGSYRVEGVTFPIVRYGSSRRAGAYCSRAEAESAATALRGTPSPVVYVSPSDPRDAVMERHQTPLWLFPVALLQVAMTAVQLLLSRRQTTA